MTDEREEEREQEPARDSESEPRPSGGSFEELDPDVVPEPDDDLDDRGGSETRLREELERKTLEAEEAQNKFLRNYADFENYRKRMQRDLAELKKFANEQLAFDLLGVVDHLELAVRHASEGGEVNQGIIEGVELVLKQLRGTLEKYGVKSFKAEGEPFDPAMHDAMMQVERDDMPENRVAQVFQAGYLYHDKVLRHAKVGVSKAPAAASPAAEGEAEPAAAAEPPEEQRSGGETSAIEDDSEE